MNINYSEKELHENVNEKELNEFRDLLFWTIEGYKYFYLRNANSIQGDEEALDLANATARVLEYFSNEVLLPEERENFKLIQSTDTVDEDIKNIERLFMNSYRLRSTNNLNKASMREYMKFYQATDEDFEYVDEYNSYSKIILAAGAVGMHKDEIVRLSERPLIVSRDYACNEEDIITDILDRKKAVLYAKDVSEKEKRRLNKSLDYLCDYQIMINNEYLNQEYYFVDDFTQEKVYKPRI